MSSVTAFAEACAPQMLSLFRMVVALLYLEHGTAKLFHFPHVKMFDNLPLFSLYGAAGMIEVIGSLFLLPGLFVRPVAFLLSGEMAIAYFHDHAPWSFFPLLNEGEAAVFYCFAFLYFAAVGGGPWSLDALRARRAGA
jgi:putative oxidoreductase